MALAMQLGKDLVQNNEDHRTRTEAEPDGKGPRPTADQKSGKDGPDGLQQATSGSPHDCLHS